MSVGDGSMKVDLQGRVALVTGAGGGIGKAIAEHFSESGATVVIAEVNSENGKAAAAKIAAKGGEAHFYELDVSCRSHVEEIAEEVRRDVGTVDILVNNAGLNVGADGRKPVHEFADDDWNRIINVDLNGPFYCIQAFGGHMVERGRGGKIINIASVVGIVPLRLQCAFAAAKAGLINLTRASALELAPHGINVNAIAPGSTLTRGTESMFYSDRERAESLLSHVPLGRPGTPEDMAYAALFLSSAASSYITGTVVVVDGGWTCGFNRDW